MKYIKLMKYIKESKIGYPFFFIKRILSAFRLSFRSTARFFRGALTSRETSTRTYPLTPENEYYLIFLVAAVTGKDRTTISGYFDEIKKNKELREFVINKIAGSHYRNKKDLRCDFGSRIAWYAIVRANKSKVVVENGIEMGLTAMALCNAIAKNREEGFEGEYYGLDINPDAGYLLINSPFTAFTKLIINESVNSLTQFKNKPIDFYFSDGLRTYDYEKKEFGVLIDKMGEQGVIVSNKANFSPALAEMASTKKKQFAYFQEQPLNHWSPGSGLGILF
jgi:predicted O-methyltransferase YrrM